MTAATHMRALMTAMESAGRSQEPDARIAEIVEEDRVLYHGTSYAALLLIVRSDRVIGNDYGNFSLTQSADMAARFAARATDYAVEAGYDADVQNPNMLPYVANRDVAKTNRSGAILVFDRHDLLRRVGADRLVTVEQPIAWGGEDVDEKETALVLDDTGGLGDVIRHCHAIRLIDNAAFQAFKSFVLRHDAGYAPTFAIIARLALGPRMTP